MKKTILFSILILFTIAGLAQAKKKIDLKVPAVEKGKSTPAQQANDHLMKALVPKAMKDTGKDRNGDVVTLSWGTIFSDGFEGPWYWSTAGYPTWRDTSYRSNTGSWSAWCADDGLSPPGPYASNMNAWMIYGPFDLSDADDARVTFSYWLNSELNYDYFWWFSSGDGTNFIGYRISGSFPYWQSQSFSLSDHLGDSSVWFAFNFDSDSSVQYEGAYVDDVIIEKYVSGPDNDDCVDAIPVVEGVPYDGSTVGATGVDESSCGDNDTADVWHSFTPTTTGIFSISLCDSAFDTTLAVYDECGGTELACNDDFCGLQSEVTVNLTVGNTYVIRVAGYNGETGSYTLLVEKCTPPPNDECVDAIPVYEGVPYDSNTYYATGDETSSCSYNDMADVWHSYTPASMGLVTISLAGSAFDTTLAVFDECDGMELACNDDTCDSYQSEITMNMTSASTYPIRIAGYDGATGDYTLTVTSSPCVLPPEPNNPNPANGANDVLLDTVLAWNGSGAEVFQADSKATISPSKGPITPEVIYGPDDRLDEYEVIDPNILAVGDSTVALVDACDLIDNGDGTFSLPAETYDVNYFSIFGRPLCSDEPFRDQPVPAFGSGFLVAPDIIATAGHCAEDCLNMAVVFGFIMLDADTPVLTIPESEIYYCSEVIVCNGGYQDGALIRLDREVTGHSPLPIRTAGIIPDDEQLLVIGHPVGLPRKYAGGATIRDNNESTYFQANLDTYVGNSGSAVFNANTLQVEGILVSGQPDWEPNGPCDSSNRCSDDAGCPGWESVTRITEFPDLLPWQRYDVYFDVNSPPTQLISSDIDVPMCESFDPCGPDGTLRPCTIYFWQVVAKNLCGETAGNIWSFTTASFAADFEPDCDVDVDDLAILCEQWLFYELSVDFAPIEGDNFVNFLDWAVFADGWQNMTDINDLAVFVAQWLRHGPYGADIAPAPDGDGIVDMLDFASLAENWRAGVE